MDRNIAATCKLDHQMQYQQQVIINGIPQGNGNAIKVPFLICPNCNNVVAQFNPGTSDIAVYQACTNELSKQIKYCVNCGQKLAYPTIIDLPDTNYTIVDEGENNI